MMRIFFVLITLIISLSAGAQRVATDYGDIYFEFFQFKEAAEYYEEALLKEEKSVKRQYIYKQLSQSYKYQFKYAKAEEYFEKYISSGEPIEPEYLIDYGNVLKLNGKYKEAKEMYKKYQEVTNTELAESFIRSVNWAMRNLDTIRNYEIFTTNLNINGQCLGYGYYDDGLLYSHSRSKPRKEKQAPVFDLDYARKVSATEFESDMKLMTFIEFDLNEGGPYVAPDGQHMYFYANNTLLNQGKPKKIGSIVVDNEGVSNFKLYVATLEGGMFKDPKPLQFCDDDFSYIHPALSEDGKTLYFSSNMEGGFGGFDLYKVAVGVDGNWGEPVNLGKNVNTDENEIFPYVNSNMIYFSSKGFNNYGGYDIFIAKLTKQGMPNTLKNIGQPINSSRDDVAFITKDDGRSGYFSSNRSNDDGLDFVYYFNEITPERFMELYGRRDTSLEVTQIAGLTNTRKLPPPTLSFAAPQKVNNSIETAPPPVIAKSDTGVQKISTQAILPGAMIEAKNKPKTQLQPIASVPKNANQTKAKQKESNRKIPKSTVTPMKSVITTYSVDELTKLNFSHILFEFNKAGINTSTMQAADSIAMLAKAQKSVKIFITAHTDCRGGFDYNLALSEKRAAAVKKYLIAKGIAASRIITRGMGESQLLNECSDDATSCTEEQHAVNRRVEMKLVK